MHTPPAGHDPVLLAEVLEGLNPQPGRTILDCTLGRGGHASEVARRLSPGGTFVGIDADPRNLEYASARVREAAPNTHARFFHANFAELDDVLDAAGLPQVDGILATSGLSTNQLFDERYGLSFAQPMPLDMRIDPRGTRTAADLVNTMREDDLANVLYELAQERYSRRIARKIGDARRVSPILDNRSVGGPRSVRHPEAGRSPGEDRPPPPARSWRCGWPSTARFENLEALLAQAPAAAQARRSAGGDQLPLDGRPIGQAGVSVGGADRATRDPHEAAPLPHRRRTRPQPAVPFGQAPRR
jgi:16S rRNA (cytosine1402-N4)-methyltransferase